MSNDHDHDHDHDHYDSPKSRRPRSEFELRTMALEAALVNNGLLATDAVDAFLEGIEHRMGPHNGARVVARAWLDPAFKARLLADGSATVAEMGFLDLLPLLGAFVLMMLMVGRQSSAAVLALAAAVCVLLVGWRHALYAAQLKRLGFHQGLACLRTPGIVLVSALLLNSARIYCLGGMVQWKGRRYSAGRG